MKNQENSKYAIYGYGKPAVALAKVRNLISILPPPVKKR